MYPRPETLIRGHACHPARDYLHAQDEGEYAFVDACGGTLVAAFESVADKNTWVEVLRQISTESEKGHPDSPDDLKMQWSQLSDLN